MIPTIIVVMLLGLIRSMQAFEVELILGSRAGIEVYSTIIYHAMTQEPPLQGVASVMSITFLVLIVPFVLLQQWYTARNTHATVGGKFSTRIQDLGAWKWPIFAVLVLLLLIMTVLPAVILVIGSFMKLFGQFNLPNPWTTRHWEAALTRHDLRQSADEHPVPGCRIGAGGHGNVFRAGLFRRPDPLLPVAGPSTCSPGFRRWCRGS